MEALGLTLPRQLQPGAALLVKQYFAEPALDVKDVIGADQLGGFAYRLDQRGKVRGDHGSSAGHGFKGREAEALIERREGKHLSGTIEYTQGFNRNEAQEAHAGFDPRVGYCAADRGILREFIPDNNQAQIAIYRVFLQFMTQHGKRFHEAGDVFVDTDSAGIKDIRVRNRIAIENLATLHRVVADGRESRVGSAVDGLKTFVRYSQHTFKIAPRSLRHCNNAGCPHHTAPVTLLMQAIAEIPALWKQQ